MWQQNPVFLLNAMHAKNDLRKQWAASFSWTEAEERRPRWSQSKVWRLVFLLHELCAALQKEAAGCAQAALGRGESPSIETLLKPSRNDALLD